MMTISRLRRSSPDMKKTIDELLVQLSASSKNISAAHLRKILGNKSTHLCVLKDGRRIIGMATLSLTYIPVGTRAWVDDVVVHESYRGRGLGQKLMEELVKIAKKSGAKDVMLTSRPSRAAANELYKKLGFEQKETNVYRLIFKK